MSLSLVHLEGQKCGSEGGGGFEDGISSPLFIAASPLSRSESLLQLFLGLHQGESASREDCGFKELAPNSLGYYSHTFVVWKASGLWRPITDLSHLNKFVLQTRFKKDGDQPVGSEG